MMRKVSIIIPVYNGYEYIRKCLESVIAQTYKNIEIIIVDDGSRDQTANVIWPYISLHPNITLIQQENKGVSCAINTARDCATGDYIAFIDADDEVMPFYIEKLIEALEEKHCQLAVCGYQSVSDKDGHVIEQTHLKDRTYSRFELLDKSLRHMDISPSIWNKLFLTSIIKKHNIRFNSSITIGEDMLFLVEYSLYVDQCITMSHQLYRYYIRSKSTMTQWKDENKFNEKWLAEWKAVNLVENMLQQYIGTTKSLKLKKTRVANKLLSMMKHFDYADEILEKELLSTVRKNILYALLGVEFTIKEKIKILLNAISPKLCMTVKDKTNGMRKYGVDQKD